MPRLSAPFSSCAAQFDPLATRSRLSWFWLLGLALFVGVPGATSTFAQSPSETHEIPARFTANRIHVFPVTTQGDTLHLNTDTGGGPPILLRPAVNRLNMPVDTLSRGGRSRQTVPFPQFKTEASIPAPHGPNRLLVLPNRGPAKFLDADGQLGNSWFAGKVWTFDYGAERLLLHDSAENLSFNPEHTVPITFRTDSTGRHLHHHARIEATIADSTYSFLFDTGATFVLTKKGQDALGGPQKQGGNFLIASVFDRLRNEHPNWRIVENATGFRNRNRPLIQVPNVTIAGHTVGPVWFERQPDRAFQKGRKLSLDRDVEGALGGSLFQYFRITVDYPGERAHFQQVN